MKKNRQKSVAGVGICYFQNPHPRSNQKQTPGTVSLVSKQEISTYMKYHLKLIESITVVSNQPHNLGFYYFSRTRSIVFIRGIKIRHFEKWIRYLLFFHTVNILFLYVKKLKIKNISKWEKENKGMEKVTRREEEISCHEST